MTITQKFSKIASYQSPNFQDWFGDMEFKNKKSKLYFKKLELEMNDAEIIKKFNPTELTLGEVHNYLKKADKKDWMLFYCRDKYNILRAVDVFCRDFGWDLHAYSLETTLRWNGGYRVFSRKKINTQSISPSDLPNELNINGTIYIKQWTEK